METSMDKTTDGAEPQGAAKGAYVEPNIPKQLLSPYNPEATEKAVYDIEMASGFFNPDKMIEAGLIDESAEAHSIILPPPNVTGTLHLGHGLMVTFEDILTRFARMQGKKALWIPGTDHAAIATQSKVEKDISKKEGKSRHDLGREELLSRIGKFADQSHDTIVSQVRRMGASCDWSREAFTLDAARNKAVNHAFSSMFKDGLIYRGNRIVNWDPKGQTTIADDEIVYEDRQATLYTFKYSKDFPLSISTTRPETKIGDVAVAVHPEDERYSAFVGKEYDADFCGSGIHIRIVADTAAEKEFGTGAVGVTPAHSMADWDIAERHGLPHVQVINEEGRMMVDASSPLYDAEKKKGKKAAEAREAVAAWLREAGLMEKEETVAQRVSTAERTGGIIEPLPKTQWWVAVNKPFTIRHSEIKGIESGSKTTLKELMIKAVANGQVELMPEHFDKTYFHWIENLRDWCISRQIWYGHRIPVWYRKATEGSANANKDGIAPDAEVYCGMVPPAEAGHDGEWVQDPDTLDTWFSSGLWTISTMGWPDAYDEKAGKAIAGSDLARFHPTATLVTGYDIIFFWVARMILMTGYSIGQIPFNTVYFSGMVRDSKGQKMSKSLGNGGDPIELSDKYGADALRMFYAASSTPGMDPRIHEDKIRGYKHFGNKLWNITRFILTYTENINAKHDPSFTAWSEKDAQLIKEQVEFIAAVTKETGERRIHLASEKIYHYAWSTLADVILEESKLIFMGRVENAEKGLTAVAAGTSEEQASRAQFLLHTLRTLVKVIHPFMPHVTEELWSIITTDRSLIERASDGSLDNATLLMVQKWPL